MGLARELAHPQAVLFEQRHENRAVARPHVAPAGCAETVVQLLVPALGGLGEQEAEIVSIHKLVLYQTKACWAPRPRPGRRPGLTQRSRLRKTPIRVSDRG